MTLYKMTHGRTVGLALALAIVPLLSACESDPVVDVTADRPVLEMLLAPGDAILPAGDVALGEIVQFTNFDVTVPDAFGRSVDSPAFFTEGSYLAVAGHDASRDPRIPAPLGAFRTFDFYIGGPDASDALDAGDAYNFWQPNNIALDPTKRYSFGLARYAVEIVGQLDQEEMLLEGQITEPDRLVLVDPNPGGHLLAGSNWNEWDREVDPEPCRAPVPGTNPMILGSVMGSGEGMQGGAIDLVICAGSIWYKDEFDPDMHPIAPNVLGTFGPNQYNHVVIYEADPATGEPFLDRVVVRRQLGPEIELGTTNRVANNTFAPFPQTVIDTATAPSLPGGATAFVWPDTMVLTLSGLPVLSGGTWAAYAFDEATSAFTLIRTFDSPGAEEEFDLVLGGGGEAFDFTPFTHVVLSMEAGTPGASPSTPVLVHPFTTGSGTLAFGTFNPATATVNQFQIDGAGLGQFIGDSLIVRLNRLTPPPTGFHYQSYVLALSATGEIEDELRLHTVELDEEGDARDAIDEAEVGGFHMWNAYVLILEPNIAPGLTPAMIQVSEDWTDKFADYFAPPES